MFEFLMRRHAAPAETPLSEVRFTRGGSVGPWMSKSNWQVMCT